METEAVTNSLQEVISLFRGLEGAWGRTTSHLKALHDSIAKDQVSDTAYDAKASKQVIDMWNELGQLSK